LGRITSPRCLPSSSGLRLRRPPSSAESISLVGLPIRTRTSTVSPSRPTSLTRAGGASWTAEMPARIGSRTRPSTIANRRSRSEPGAGNHQAGRAGTVQRADGRNPAAGERTATGTPSTLVIVLFVPVFLACRPGDRLRGVQLGGPLRGGRLATDPGRQEHQVGAGQPRVAGLRGVQQFG